MTHPRESFIANILIAPDELFRIARQVIVRMRTIWVAPIEKICANVIDVDSQQWMGKLFTECLGNVGRYVFIFAERNPLVLTNRLRRKK